jgi:hypothetical protein
MRDLGSILAVLRSVLHREEITGVNATAEAQPPFGAMPVSQERPP